MISLQYSEFVQKSLKYPKFGVINKNSKFEDLRFKEKSLADFIFEFEGNKTVYMKNGYTSPPQGYQFTDEEKLVIVLSAVPL